MQIIFIHTAKYKCIRFFGTKTDEKFIENKNKNKIKYKRDCSSIDNDNGNLESFSLFLLSLRQYYDQKGEINCPLPDKPFLEWFIGFAEGDGCFFINNRKELSFICVQGIANLSVLQKIKEKLNMGIILKQGKRVYRFIIQRKDEIRLIIQLFNGNVVLASRKIQFQKFCNCFQEKAKHEEKSYEYIKKRNMILKNSLWLLGFVEAEGCFSISFLSSSNNFRVRFLLSQKGDENLPVLSSLIPFFGVGQIERHSAKNNYSYIVSGLKNIEKIYPYFDNNLQYFLGTKKESYLNFKKLVEKIKQKQHLEKEKRPYLIQLAKQINSASRKCK